MACFYYKGKEGGEDFKQYASPKEMVEEFIKYSAIKSGQQLSAAIYSSEEIQQTVYNTITSKHSPKKYYEDSSYEEDLEFISRPNNKAFEQIEDLIDNSRLTPEYIKENRMPNYIIQKMKGSQNEAGPEVVVNAANMDAVMNNPDIKKLLLNGEASEENIRYWLADYEKRIAFEEKVVDLSTIIHKMVYARLGGKSVEAAFEQEFAKANKEGFQTDIFGEDTSDNIANWKTKLTEQVREIGNFISAYGLTFTELKMVYADKHNKIKSAIDIIAIGENGVVHIFEIQASDRSYEEWDDAKRLTSDWSLAVKRQMIGQHVDITGAELYVLPLHITSLKNPSAVRFSGKETRTADVKSGVVEGNKISTIADKLLPRKIFPKLDLTRVDKMRNRLNQVIGSEYEIRTEFEDNNVDLIVASAERAYANSDSYKFFNNLETVDGLKYGKLEVIPKDQTKEEKAIAKEKFRAKIEKYVAHIKAQENRGVAAMYTAINTALNAKENVKVSKHSDKLQHILNEYLNEDHEVINMQESIPMGIVVLRHKYNNTIHIFNLSIDNFRAPVQEKGLEEFSNRLYKDLDILKAMIFIDEFKKDLLPNSSFKLGQLISFNPKNGDNYYTPMVEALELYRNQMTKRKLFNEITILDSDLLGIEDIALHDVITVLTQYEGKDQKHVDEIIEIIGDGTLIDIDKERLIQARKVFLQHFPEYLNQTPDAKLNFNDQLSVIFALLQTAILVREGIIMHGDFRDLTKFSIQWGDLKSLIKPLYTKNIEQYDLAGRKIQGLFQGLVWAAPDHVQSKDLQQINTLMSTGNSVIGEKLIKANEKIAPLTKEFYESINYNMRKRMISGKSQSKYRNLFLDNNEYTTKNPYKLNEVNALKENESKYLKQMLLLINQYVHGISEEDIAKIDPMDIESIKQNEVLKKHLESGRYFEMPLMRREEISKYDKAFVINGEDLNIKKAMQDNIRSWVDGRELSKYDLTNISEQSLGFFEMYDPYSNQTGELRAKILSNNSASYFEMNLDTIAHKVAFTKIRKQTFDLILPTINAYIWWIKLMGAKQSVKVDDQIEYIINQVKLAVLDQPLIGDEMQTLAKGLGFVKQISTVSMLAFRPALLAKEMTIGVLRNFSSAAIGLNDDFDAETMTKAYQKLITIDKKFSDEFNMIDKLNHLYRMANMDISTMPKKVQADRWGYHKGLGRYMFMTSTLGDYYNRMAILLAKMIKEGSYDAHSMVDGNLRYDAKKDKRFEHYFQHRESVKDAEGNYTSKKGDVKYNTQRRLYLLTIDQMNREGAVTNEKKLTEKSIIEKAYSHQDRDSIKSFSDQMYGAYDKDWQAQFGNTLMGIAFMQFLTFWPSKMKFWFGKTVDGKDSTIGKSRQQRQTDENGVVLKNDDGTDVLMWRETYIDDEGKTVWKPTTENTGDPIIVWEGTPQEGVFISLLYTIQDILKWDTKSLKNNTLRKNRAMFALIDGVLMVLILKIMQQIWNGLVSDDERGTMTGELKAFMGTVNTKILREFDVWDNTFGALNTEPVFLSWGIRSANNIMDAFTSNKELGKLAANSIGALEHLKEYR